MAENVAFVDWIRSAPHVYDVSRSDVALGVKPIATKMMTMNLSNWISRVDPIWLKISMKDPARIIALTPLAPRWALTVVVY